MLGRDRELERAWRRRVRVQRTSGRSVRSFCEWEGLPESAFDFWRRELERRDAERSETAAGRRPRPAADTRPRFVPVVVSEDISAAAPARAGIARPATAVSGAPLPASAAVIELVHPGGIVVRVPAGSEAAALRTVLGVLDERSTVSADTQAEAQRC
jgi:hypothetical protein